MAQPRIHAFDTVRTFALLLGVVYHAAHAWSALLHVPWIVEARDGSWLLAGVEHVSHLFRMPVFYALAGFFAAMLIDRRGVVEFLANRMARIVLPLLIFLPILGVALFMVVRAAPPDLSPLLQAAHAPPDPDAPPRAFETFHLWFLVYLTWFCALAAIAQRIPWRIPTGLYRSPWTLVWLPALLVPALASTQVPAQSPTALAPALWPFGYFGIFFALGMGLYRVPDALDRLGRGAWVLALGCAVGCPLFVWGVATGLERWILVGLEAWLSLALTVLVFWAGRRWFDREIPWARALSDASYWIYLVHLPVVLWLQVKLAPLGWPAGIAFGICVIATIAIGLASYALLVRRTPIGTLLNGRRR